MTFKSKMTEVFQNYKPDNEEHFSYNELITDNYYKIEICLKCLMLRKNMSFKNIMKQINYFFLLEFLCVILQEQDLWTPKICNGGSYCNIKKAINVIEMMK